MSASKDVYLEVRMASGSGCLVLLEDGCEVDRGALQQLSERGITFVSLAEVAAAVDWVQAGPNAVRIQTPSRWMSTEFEALSQWGHPELSIVTHGEDGVTRRSTVLSRQSGEVIAVGRKGGGCDIEIDDRHVSNRHLELRYRDGSWRVRDAKSRHGTKLNGKPIARGVKLSHGDELTIGRTVIRYVDYDEELRRLMVRDPDVAAKAASRDASEAGAEPRSGRADEARESSASAGRSLLGWLVALGVLLAITTLVIVVVMMLREFHIMPTRE